jgi:repressor LexA
MNTPTISEKQQQICAYLYVYTQHAGFPPTNREIGREMGFIGSKGRIHTGQVDYHLTILMKKGYINRAARQARSITLTLKGLQLVKQLLGLTDTPQPEEQAQPEQKGLQLLGITAAGTPRGAFPETNQFIHPLDGLATDNVYALLVEGNSMIEDHICNGDYVVIKPQSNYKNGDMVVAVNSNQGLDEVTLKRFYKEGDQIRLQPANSTMNPIFINQDDWDRSWNIQGKVVASFRRNFEG